MTERIPYEKPSLLEPTRTKLEPCPFCGRQVKVAGGAIVCHHCGLSFHYSVNYELNCDAWNRRTS